MNLSEEVKRATDAYLASLGLTPAKLQAIENGIAPDEVAVIPETKLILAAKPKRAPDFELDVRIGFGGSNWDYQTFDVWGGYHPARKGGHEPGERPYEPDDPAGFEIHTVCIGESDVTGDLSQDVLDMIANKCCELYEERTE